MDEFQQKTKSFQNNIKIKISPRHDNHLREEGKEKFFLDWKWNSRVTSTSRTLSGGDIMQYILVSLSRFEWIMSAFLYYEKKNHNNSFGRVKLRVGGGARSATEHENCNKFFRNKIVI